MDLGLSENGADETDMAIQIGENNENDGSNETCAPIIPDEIVVQPPPLSRRIGSPVASLQGHSR